MVDDLRPELGVYGNTTIKTPRIDDFARTGEVFDRAFVSVAVCAPSRGALMTGLRPDTTGMIDLNQTVESTVPNAVTLIDLFKAAGYTTIGIDKIYHDPTDDTEGWSVPHMEANAPVIDTFARSTIRWTGPTLQDTNAAQLAKAKLGELKAANKPFFLALGFRKPHLPFIAPATEWDKYTASDIPPPINPQGQTGNYPWSFVLGELPEYQDLAPLLPNLPASKVTELRWGYYAAITYIDGLVGDVLDGLKQQGLENDTIVVLWGDNGFKLDDHAAWAKHSNADLDIRIPLIVRVPGRTVGGSHATGIVESVDIYPTLAELAGLSPPANLEGLSFAPLLPSPAKAWKEAAYAQYQRPPQFTDGRGTLTGYTVRTDRYRYTAWINTSGAVKGQELYDLANDPVESTNIVGRAPYAATLTSLEQTRQAGWRATRAKITG